VCVCVCVYVCVYVCVCLELGSSENTRTERAFDPRQARHAAAARQQQRHHRAPGHNVLRLRRLRHVKGACDARKFQGVEGRWRGLLAARSAVEFKPAVTNQQGLQLAIDDNYDVCDTAIDDNYDVCVTLQ